MDEIIIWPSSEITSCPYLVNNTRHSRKARIKEKLKLFSITDSVQVRPKVGVKDTKRSKYERKEATIERIDWLLV